MALSRGDRLLPAGGGGAEVEIFAIEIDIYQKTVPFWERFLYGVMRTIDRGLFIVYKCCG